MAFKSGRNLSAYGLNFLTVAASGEVAGTTGKSIVVLGYSLAGEAELKSGSTVFLKAKDATYTGSPWTPAFAVDAGAKLEVSGSGHLTFLIV